MPSTPTPYCTPLSIPGESIIPVHGTNELAHAFVLQAHVLLPQPTASDPHHLARGRRAWYPQSRPNFAETTQRFDRYIKRSHDLMFAQVPYWYKHDWKRANKRVQKPGVAVQRGPTRAAQGINPSENRQY